MNVTRLPDTRPLLRRRPRTKDLSPAPRVLGQVQRDEDGVGKRSFERVGRQVNSVTASCGHRGDPDRTARLRR